MISRALIDYSTVWLKYKRTRPNVEPMELTRCQLCSSVLLYRVLYAQTIHMARRRAQHAAASYHRSVIGAFSSKQCKSGGISVSMHSLAAGAGLIEARVARIRVALRARLRLWHARRGPACGALRRCGLRARRRLVRAFVRLCVDLRHVHATRLTRVHGDSGCGRAPGMVRRGNRPPPHPAISAAPS